MSTVTKTELVDDLAGGPADETVSFGLDGTMFDIDLSANRAGVLRDILSDYVEHGRKVGKLGTPAVQRKVGQPAGSGSTAAPARASREHTQAVRAWANQNGYSVSDRGRIPLEVAKAFDEAHRGSKLAAVG